MLPILAKAGRNYITREEYLVLRFFLAESVSTEGFFARPLEDIVKERTPKMTVENIVYDAINP